MDVFATGYHRSATKLKHVLFCRTCTYRQNITFSYEFTVAPAGQKIENTSGQEQDSRSILNRSDA